MSKNLLKKSFALIGAGIMTLSMGIMVTTGTLTAHAQTSPAKININGNYELGSIFSIKEDFEDMLFVSETGQQLVLADTKIDSPISNTIKNHRLGWFSISGEANLQPITLQGGFAATKVDYRISPSSKITPVDIGLGKLLVVNAPKGVIVRDAKCAKVGSQGYANTVKLRSNKTIDCNVNGRNFKMTAITNIYGSVNTDSSDLFIASQFLSPLITNYNLDAHTVPGKLKKLKVNNPAGLNLRDENCRIRATVSNGTVLEQPEGGQGGTIAICKAGKQFYEMTNISYNGKVYQVAMALLINA